MSRPKIQHGVLLAGLLVVVSNLALADLIDGEEFLDPTRPLFFTAESEGAVSDDVMTMIRDVLPSSFDVSFIRASGSTPMAVVNSQRVTIGDSIGGASVVAIDRSSVTLSINGAERKISLYGNSIKSPATQ